MHAPLWLLMLSSTLPAQQIAFSESTVVRLVPLPTYEPVLRLSHLTPFTQQRPKAVELSEGYYTRLKIHRYTSYAMVPLFVGQYIVGKKLYNQPGDDQLQSLHGALATGMYAGFAVNTVTGAWNLWETRAQPEGRTRRYVHSALMFLAGAGFVATGMLAPDDEGEGSGGGTSPSSQATKHRNMAIASMSTALVGGLMMVFWK